MKPEPLGRISPTVRNTTSIKYVFHNIKNFVGQGFEPEFLAFYVFTFGLG
jgi:hypothetical protein